MKKLSFSIPSKSSSNPNPRASQPFSDSDDQHHDHHPSTHEYITEFNPSKPPAHDSPPPKTLIIPPIQNQWHPQDNSHHLPFEIAADSSLESDFSYGLNLRHPVGDEQPRLEDVILQRLRDELRRPPDEGKLEEYEEVPVEGYGAAVLKGYGWREGMGIGRNAKEDVKVVRYEARGNRAGLGFVPNKETVKTGTE